jgi:hypothetical protein
LMTTITQVNGRHFGILPCLPQAVLNVTEQVPRRKQLDRRLAVRRGLLVGPMAASRSHSGEASSPTSEPLPVRRPVAVQRRD